MAAEAGLGLGVQERGNDREGFSDRKDMRKGKQERENEGGMMREGQRHGIKER